MLRINPVSIAQTQSLELKQNNKKIMSKPIPSESACDSICFKGGAQKKGILDGIKKILGITTAGATVVTATKLATKETEKKAEAIADEWNSESKGYKKLTDAGFSNELIDKTIDKMEKSEAESLKQGLDKIYINNSERMISGIFEGLNKDIQDDEKSAEITFKLLSEIFKRSKDNQIYLYGVYASIKFEGAKVFEKGTLNNGGTFGDNFTFLDKEGDSLGADRIRKRIDSDGNTIVERVDCDGNVSKKGKKYDKNDRKIEEWDEFTRTELHYDENNVLCKKVKHMTYATETLTLVNGEWKSDKEGGWKDW